MTQGRHGFFHAFADSGITPDFDLICASLGNGWRMCGVAFKPYACGTMCQPFIDCAIALARKGVAAQNVVDIRCKVGEATVHRLWGPFEEKRNPSTPYSAKFSVPYCVAVALIDRAAGLEQFTSSRVSRSDVRELAGEVPYEVDPANEYPVSYSGHLRVTMRGRSAHEVSQPYLRGGVREPLAPAEILAKFGANVAFGGWPDGLAGRLAAYCRSLSERCDLRGLAEFRT